MTPTTGFLNRPELLAGDRTPARAAALDIAAAGLSALDPETATLRSLAREEAELVVDGRRHPLAGRGVHVIGAGKASVAIARALVSLAGDDLNGGVVVAHHAGGASLGERVEVLEADHPIPSERSHVAGARLVEVAGTIAPGDLVLACFTGGSSALVSVPAPGIAEQEKGVVSELLLASGLDIIDMNTVRKHISAIKGGRLAALFPQATILNLTVSDVAGDHLDSITDPTVQDTSTSADAAEILKKNGLWERVPSSVRDRLQQAVPSPDLSGVDVQTVVVATGLDACRAMQERAADLGYASHVVSTAWAGEAVENGRSAAELALACRRGRGVVNEPGALVACGGESTVSLTDWASHAGHGGPNQEFALSAASSISGEPEIAVVALDTDGRDGGTEWAGALVDGTTAPRLGQEALDEALAAHTATQALSYTGDLVACGATGTNVNDLYVVVVGNA